MADMPTKPAAGGPWLAWGDAADHTLRGQPALESELLSRGAQIDAIEDSKADKASLALVATTGAYSNLAGAPPTTGLLFTDSMIRPTSSPAYRVMFRTPTPPAGMLPGDLWEPRDP